MSTQRIPPGLDLEAEILRLAKERNAVILAHYYQESEIQDLADFVGDSLALARAAQRTEADVILFCGVHFMAETAKILNPERIVVLPDLEAGCSLSDSCPAPALAAWREEHPDHAVVSYINCSAGVKALSDLICTSSNAEAVVASLPADQPILFAPDKNLGGWLNKELGRDMDLWPGACIVHETFSEKKIIRLKVEHPGAELLAHPECEDAVLRHADYIGSTSGILRHARESDTQTFIVATEEGILHQMRKESPGKTLIPAPPDGNCACNQCPFMRLNTLQKCYLALRDLKPRIELDESVRTRALAPLQRMLDISASAVPEAAGQQP